MFTVPERCRNEQCPFDIKEYAADGPYIRLFAESIRNRRNAGHDLFVRFMSRDEFAALDRGDELENLTDHSEQNYSTSVGFCFMPIHREGDEFNELVALSESVWSTIYSCLWDKSNYVCVVFEATSDAGLKKTSGRYPYALRTQWVTEYSTTHYSRETMRPVAITYYDYDWQYK